MKFLQNFNFNFTTSVLINRKLSFCEFLKDRFQFLQIGSSIRLKADVTFNYNQQTEIEILIQSQDQLF